MKRNLNASYGALEGFYAMFGVFVCIADDNMASSVGLCGGTHLTNIAEVGPLKPCNGRL
jgi:alanyl-tRNA synthetase